MADTKLLDIHTQLAGVDENKDKLELSDLRGASELLRHKAIQDLRSMREDLYVKLLKNPKDKDLNDQKKALASFVSELLRLDSEYQSRKDSTIEQTSAVVDTIKELFREAKNTEIRLIELKSDVEKNAVNRWFKRVSIYNKDEERINQGSFEKLLTNHDATELIEGLRKIDDIEERKKYLNRNWYSAKRVFDDKELQVLETLIEQAAFSVSSRKNETKHKDGKVEKMDSTKISSVLNFLADFDGDGKLEIKNKWVFTDYQGQFLSEAQMREALNDIKDVDTLKKVLAVLWIEYVDMKDEKQAKSLRAEFLKTIKLRYDMGASIESILSGDVTKIKSSVAEYQALEQKSWEKMNKTSRDDILKEIGERLKKQDPKAKAMFDDYKAKNPQGTKEMFLEQVRKSTLEGLYVSGGYKGLNAAASLNVSEMTDGVIDHILITTLGPAVSKDLVNSGRHKLTVVGSFGGGVDYTYQASRGLTLGFSVGAGKINGEWKSVAGIRAMYETYNGSDRRIYDILDATNRVVDKFVNNAQNKPLNELLKETQADINNKHVNSNLEKSEFSVENLSASEKAELQKALEFFKSLPEDQRASAKIALLRHMEMSLRDERNGWHIGSIWVGAAANLKTGSILVAPLVTFVRFYTKHEKLDTTRLGTEVSRLSEAKGSTLDEKVDAAIKGVNGKKKTMVIKDGKFVESNEKEAREYLYIPDMKKNQVSAPTGVTVMEYGEGLLIGGKLHGDKWGLSLVKKTLLLSGGTQEIFVVGDLDINARGQAVRRLDFSIAKKLTDMKQAEFVSQEARDIEMNAEKPAEAQKWLETQVDLGGGMDTRIKKHTELNKTFSNTISRRTLNKFLFLRDFSVDIDMVAQKKDLKGVDDMYARLRECFAEKGRLAKYTDQKEKGGAKIIQEALEANKNAATDVKLYILRMFQRNFNKDINTEKQLGLDSQAKYDKNLADLKKRQEKISEQLKSKPNDKTLKNDFLEVEHRIQDMKRTLDRFDAERDGAFAKRMKEAVNIYKTELQDKDESDEKFNKDVNAMLRVIWVKKETLRKSLLKDTKWMKEKEIVTPEYMMFEVDSKVDLNDDKKGYHLMKDSKWRSLAGLKAKPGVVRYAAKPWQEGFEQNSIDIDNELHKKLLISMLPEYVFSDIAKTLTDKAKEFYGEGVKEVTVQDVKTLFINPTVPLTRWNKPSGKYIDFWASVATRIFKSADCINDAYSLKLGLKYTPNVPGEPPKTTDFPVKFGAGRVTVGNTQEQVRQEIGGGYTRKVHSGWEKPAPRGSSVTDDPGSSDTPQWD